MYAPFKLQSRWIKSPTVQHTAGAQTTAAQPSLWNYADLFFFVLKKVCLCTVPGWVWMTGNPDWPQGEEGLEITYSNLSQTIIHHIGGHIKGEIFSPLPQTYSSILELQICSYYHLHTPVLAKIQDCDWSFVPTDVTENFTEQRVAIIWSIYNFILLCLCLVLN